MAIVKSVDRFVVDSGPLAGALRGEAEIQFVDGQIKFIGFPIEADASDDRIREIAQETADVMERVRDRPMAGSA